MSFSHGVTAKVISARLLYFVPVIPGLERPFLGRKNEYLGEKVIANQIKKLALW